MRVWSQTKGHLRKVKVKGGGAKRVYVKPHANKINRKPKKR